MKKLTLSKETLRTLNQAEAADVAGGAYPTRIAAGTCLTWTCSGNKNCNIAIG